MKSTYKLLITCAFLIMQVNVNAQILKKLKNKVDNAIDKTVDKKIDNKIEKTTSNNYTKDYCEDKEVLKNYKIIYTGNDATRIFYDESSISMNSDGDSYRIIFKEGTGKAVKYTVIENGKTLYTGTSLPATWVQKSNKQNDRDRVSKYLVVDSSKTNLAGSKETTITTSTIDEDRFKTGAELSKQTAEYQAMSAEEKAEYDDFVKNEAPQAIRDYNKTLANKTYSSPGIGPMTIYTGNTSLMVKGKNYLKKGDILNDFYVSEDEKNVFAFGMESNGKSFFQANDKRTYIETPKDDYSMSSQLLVARDGKKASVINILSIPENNVENVYVNNALTNAMVTNSDGTIKNIKVNMENYMLSNDGKIISANKNTGEVFIDGNTAGKFNTNNENPIEVSSLLIAGSTPDKIGRYKPNGSIDFLDGKTKNLGALFPIVKNINGKAVLYWFMECDNTIYLANTEF